MADIGGVILNVGAGVLTGIVTGAVSVRFALRRFRAERTWERKVAAYTEIFDALYNIQRYARMRLTEIEEGATFVKEYEEQASRLSSQGYDAVRRAAIKGTFIVGAEAAARLELLVSVFDDAHDGDDLHDAISAHLAAAEEALVDLRTIANADVHETGALDSRLMQKHPISGAHRRPTLPSDR